MQASQLVKDLQTRLSSLLKDPRFAKARHDRAVQKKGRIEDALIAHNMAVSEEILYLNPSSAGGVVGDRKIDAFRKQIAAYTEHNGTGHRGYNEYIAIFSEYLALVVQKPLHPEEVRFLENDPPEDNGRRSYCAWKARHVKDSGSLCRFCNCRPWPEAAGGGSEQKMLLRDA